jgi:hypothetical protein
MSPQHAKLSEHAGLGPVSLRLGALAIAAVVVGGFVFETARLAAGILA